MAVIQTKHLKDRIKGDTFASVNFTHSDSVTSNPIDLTGATIRVQFRYRKKTGTTVKDMAIGTGVTVTTPANGIVTIDAFEPITFEVDTYYYDIEITFSTGKIKTYVQGTFKVLQDVTDN